MSTLTTVASPVTVPIRCPEWCEVSADHHAAELSNWDGHLVHSTHWNIFDPSGQMFGDWPDWEVKPASPVGITFGTTADLDGRETGTPVVLLNSVEMTIEQALLVAEALKDVVEDYVAHGGEIRMHGHDWRDQFEVTPRRLLTEEPPYEPMPDPDKVTTG